MLLFLHLILIRNQSLWLSVLFASSCSRADHIRLTELIQMLAKCAISQITTYTKIYSELQNNKYTYTVFMSRHCTGRCILYRPQASCDILLATWRLCCEQSLVLPIASRPLTQDLNKPGRVWGQSLAKATSSYSHPWPKATSRGKLEDGQLDGR